MKSDSLLIFVLCLALLNLAFAPAVGKKIGEGNKLFDEQKYDEALRKYTDAQIERPESAELFFNIANTLYRQRKYQEAEQMLVKAIPQAAPDLESKIYYNIGNCKYRQGQLRESLDYYKQSLELNPDDEDAKYNIEFVERKIKEMLSQSQKRQEQQQQQEQEQQQPQDQQQQGQQEEQQEGQEQQQQEQQQGEQQEEEKTAAGVEEGEKEKEPEEKEEEQKAGEEEKEEEQRFQAEQQEESGTAEQQPLPSPDELSREEAEALLRMITDEERSGERPEEKNLRPTRYQEMEKIW